jgi:signal transduction histidine kinase
MLRRYDRDHELMPDPLPSRRKIAVSVGLNDGGWAVFTTPVDLLSPNWGLRMGLWLLLALTTVGLVAIWISRRVTAPIVRFADAADRLGVDDAAPPLAESGPDEIERAARAFNRMQQRIRRLIDDRTRILAAISHDLRTALTRMRLRAEFIEDAEQQKKAETDLDDMQTMLDSFLAFARDEADAGRAPRSTWRR